MAHAHHSPLAAFTRFSPTPADGTLLASSPSSFRVELRANTYSLASGRVLWHNINHTFHARRTGLVGRNGSGKSLFLQMLMGALPAHGGTVLRHGSVCYVPQEIVVTPDQTIADASGLTPILRALARIEQGCPEERDFELAEGRWLIREELERALHACGLNTLAANTPIRHLSGGELTRVALIGAFLSGAQGLLLDEPSNHLDAQSRRWLCESLRQWRGGAIVVSHDRELLETMDEIITLEQAALRCYTGNYSSYREHRARQTRAAQAALEHASIERRVQLRKMQREHDAQLRRNAHRNTQAKTENQAAISLGKARNNAEKHAGRDQHRRTKEREDLNMALRLAAAHVNDAPPVALTLPVTPIPMGRRVLHLEEIVLPNLASSRPLNLTLSGPIRLVIQGPNGCGKTSLLKLMAGAIAPLHGRCVTGVPSAWLDQHAKGLTSGASLLQHLLDMGTRLPQGELRSALALMGLGAEHVTIDVACLSGGERIKAALACALWRRQPAQLLLLDEPTNHLDLDSVIALEQALSIYRGALVAVSHDGHFLDTLRPSHRLTWIAGEWQLTQSQD